MVNVGFVISIHKRYRDRSLVSIFSLQFRQQLTNIDFIYLKKCQTKDGSGNVIQCDFH